MTEIRPVRPDELQTYIKTLFTAFGGRAVEATVEPLTAAIEMDRFFAAVDGDAIVGTGGTLSLQLTVPGGATIPAGGLTFIGVLPTHRRQGILRRMMMRHLEDVMARGEPVGALFASEAAIYGRFGYGIATMMARHEIETAGSAFAVPLEDGGSVHFVDRETMLGLLPELHGRIHKRTVGDVSRSDELWRSVFAEWAEDESGWQGFHHVLHRDADGEPDGYAIYKLGEDAWPDSLPKMRIDVYKVAGLTDAVRHRLLRFIFDLDLVGTVRNLAAPVDEPLRWLLADPRQLRTIRVWDGLWLRIVDVPAALSGRRYETPGQLTIQVTDDVLPDVAGTFELDAGPADATCVPTRRDPDLVLGVTALSSIYLGGVSATALATAGRIEEVTPGAVAVADRMFLTARAPFCNTDF
jgi:predicted acetyltransferase